MKFSLANMANPLLSNKNFLKTNKPNMANPLLANTRLLEMNEPFLRKDGRLLRKTETLLSVTKPLLSETKLLLRTIIRSKSSLTKNIRAIYTRKNKTRLK